MSESRVCSSTGSSPTSTGSGLAGTPRCCFGSAAAGSTFPGGPTSTCCWCGSGDDGLAPLWRGQAAGRWRHERPRRCRSCSRAVEWLRSADAYPLEIAEMRTAYRVLRGADPLARDDGRPGRPAGGAGAGVPWQADAPAAGLCPVCARVRRRWPSSSEAVPRPYCCCAGACWSCGATRRPSRPSWSSRAQRSGRDSRPKRCTGSWPARADAAWRCTEEDVRGYLAAVEAAAGFVDHFQIGART